MYRVELGNGNIISDVTIEGVTCFTEQEITRADFEYGLHEVKFIRLLDSQTDESEIAPGTYHNMKLITCVPCRPRPGFYMFEFAPMSEQELKDLTVESRLDYLEMMSE